MKMSCIPIKAHHAILSAQACSKSLGECDGLEDVNSSELHSLSEAPFFTPIVVERSKLLSLAALLMYSE